MQTEIDRGRHRPAPLRFRFAREISLPFLSFQALSDLSQVFEVADIFTLIQIFAGYFLNDLCMLRTNVPYEKICKHHDSSRPRYGFSSKKVNQS